MYLYNPLTNFAPQHKGVVLVMSAVLLSSMAPIFFREMTLLAPIWACMAAMFVAAAGLSCGTLWHKSQRQLPHSPWFWLWTVGIVLTSLTGNWSIMEALQSLNPASASTIQRTELIFAAILGALFLGERLNKHFIVALLLAVGGLLFFRRQQLDLGGDNLDGVLLALFSGASFAVLLLFSKKALRYASAGMINNTRLILSVAVLFCFPQVRQAVFEVPPMVWLLAVACALSGPMGARYLLTEAIAYIPLSQAMLYTLLAPIFTALCQFLLFGELLTLNEIVGSALITCGVAYTFVFEAFWKK